MKIYNTIVQAFHCIFICSGASYFNHIFFFSLSTQVCAHRLSYWLLRVGLSYSSSEQEMNPRRGLYKEWCCENIAWQVYWVCVRSRATNLLVFSPWSTNHGYQPAIMAHWVSTMTDSEPQQLLLPLLKMPPRTFSAKRPDVLCSGKPVLYVKLKGAFPNHACILLSKDLCVFFCLIFVVVLETNDLFENRLGSLRPSLTQELASVSP